jgi:hypothetical protein
MSLDVAEAPTLAAHPLTTEQRMDVFNYSHAAGVNRDFNDARNHAKGNRYVLIVTPAHIALRLTDSSSVRVDMTGAGCESYMWLRNLYRALRPDDMRVEFGDRKQLNAVTTSKTSSCSKFASVFPGDRRKRSGQRCNDELGRTGTFPVRTNIHFTK